LANQWARLLGLKGVDEADLRRISKEIKADGVTGTLVELTGPGRPPEDREPITYDLPEGWMRTEPAQFSFLTFVVAEGKQSAKVTVSVAKGELLENMNRWRKQVGLEPQDEPAMRNDLAKIKIAGMDGLSVDLAGKDLSGKGDRILGALVEKRDGTLFFKMMGPADLLGKQKPAFEAFVKSVRLNLQGQDR
jgi:hypothetical protein